MLSKHSIEKLNMSGIYTCDPDVKYRGKMFKSNLYRCCNWTFDIVKNKDDEYFMRDTYWSDSNSFSIRLTDENMSDFSMIFERDKVKSIDKQEISHYENYYRVAIDSGGRSYPKYYVDVDAKKSKSLIIEEIEDKIKSLEHEVKSLKTQKENIENGTWKLEWY